MVRCQLNLAAHGKNMNIFCCKCKLVLSTMSLKYIIMRLTIVVQWGGTISMSLCLNLHNIWVLLNIPVDKTNRYESHTLFWLWMLSVENWTEWDMSQSIVIATHYQDTHNVSAHVNHLHLVFFCLHHVWHEYLIENFLYYLPNILLRGLMTPVIKQCLLMLRSNYHHLLH